MRILAIETSCDETAAAILEIKGGTKNVSVKIVGNALLSQIKTHAPLGGVVPNLARREHDENLIPILEMALKEANLLKPADKNKIFDEKIEKNIREMLKREVNLSKNILSTIGLIKAPKIDAIAVTVGPGLEPALWVGINFAKALGVLWNLPVIPINHMEGHIFSSLLKEKTRNHFSLTNPKFPLLALLISGGHTELVLMKRWLNYRIIGETKDDAVGEAFDKVARMLRLSYPGGPEISKLAEEARAEGIIPEVKLPRPMLHTKDFNFSFAGLKTAVLYSLQKSHEGKVDPLSYDISYDQKLEFAREFEDAAAEILFTKTKKAIKKTGAKTLILGGGVSANKHIRKVFKEAIEKEMSDTKLLIPVQPLTTDNAVMIGLAAYMRLKLNKKTSRDLRAAGNLRL